MTGQHQGKSPISQTPEKNSVPATNQQFSRSNEDPERRDQARKRKKWKQNLSVVFTDEEDLSSDSDVQRKTNCIFENNEAVALRFPYPMVSDDSDDEDKDLNYYPSVAPNINVVNKHRRISISSDDNVQLSTENESYKHKKRKSKQQENCKRTRVQTVSEVKSDKYKKSALHLTPTLKKNASHDLTSIECKRYTRNSYKVSINNDLSVVSPKNCTIPKTGNRVTRNKENSRFLDSSSEEDLIKQPARGHNKFKRIKLLSASSSGSDNEEPNKQVKKKTAHFLSSSSSSSDEKSVDNIHQTGKLVPDTSQTKLFERKNYRVHSFSSSSDGEKDIEYHFVSKNNSSDLKVPVKITPLLPSSTDKCNRLPLPVPQNNKETEENPKLGKVANKQAKNTNEVQCKPHLNSGVWKNIANAQFKRPQASSTNNLFLQNLKKQFISSNTSSIEIHRKIIEKKIDKGDNIKANKESNSKSNAIKENFTQNERQHICLSNKTSTSGNNQDQQHPIDLNINMNVKIICSPSLVDNMDSVDNRISTSPKESNNSSVPSELDLSVSLTHQENKKPSSSSCEKMKLSCSAKRTSASQFKHNDSNKLKGRTQHQHTLPKCSQTKQSGSKEDIPKRKKTVINREPVKKTPTENNDSGNDLLSNILFEMDNNPYKVQKVLLKKTMDPPAERLSWGFSTPDLHPTPSQFVLPVNLQIPEQNESINQKDIVENKLAYKQGVVADGLLDKSSPIYQTSSNVNHLETTQESTLYKNTFLSQVKSSEENAKTPMDIASFYSVNSEDYNSSLEVSIGKNQEVNSKPNYFSQGSTPQNPIIDGNCKAYASNEIIKENQAINIKESTYQSRLPKIKQLSQPVVKAKSTSSDHSSNQQNSLNKCEERINTLENFNKNLQNSKQIENAFVKKPNNSEENTNKPLNIAISSFYSVNSEDYNRPHEELLDQNTETNSNLLQNPSNQVNTPQLQILDGNSTTYPSKEIFNKNQSINIEENTLQSRVTEIQSSVVNANSTSCDSSSKQQNSLGLYEKSYKMLENLNKPLQKSKQLENTFANKPNLLKETAKKPQDIAISSFYSVNPEDYNRLNEVSANKNTESNDSLIQNPSDPDYTPQLQKLDLNSKTHPSKEIIQENNSIKNKECTLQSRVTEEHSVATSYDPSSKQHNSVDKCEESINMLDKLNKYSHKSKRLENTLAEQPNSSEENTNKPLDIVISSFYSVNSEDYNRPDEELINKNTESNGKEIIKENQSVDIEENVFQSSVTEEDQPSDPLDKAKSVSSHSPSKQNLQPNVTVSWDKLYLENRNRTEQNLKNKDYVQCVFSELSKRLAINRSPSILEQSVDCEEVSNISFPISSNNSNLKNTILSSSKESSTPLETDTVNHTLSNKKVNTSPDRENSFISDSKPSKGIRIRVNGTVYRLAGKENIVDNHVKKQKENVLSSMAESDNQKETDTSLNISGDNNNLSSPCMDNTESQNDKSSSSSEDSSDDSSSSEDKLIVSEASSESSSSESSSEDDNEETAVKSIKVSNKISTEDETSKNYKIMKNENTNLKITNSETSELNESPKSKSKSFSLDELLGFNKKNQTKATLPTESFVNITKDEIITLSSSSESESKEGPNNRICKHKRVAKKVITCLDKNSDCLKTSDDVSKTQNPHLNVPIKNNVWKIRVKSLEELGISTACPLPDNALQSRTVKPTEQTMPAGRPHTCSLPENALQSSTVSIEPTEQTLQDRISKAELSDSAEQSSRLSKEQSFTAQPLAKSVVNVLNPTTSEPIGSDVKKNTKVQPSHKDKGGILSNKGGKIRKTVKEPNVQKPIKVKIISKDNNPSHSSSKPKSSGSSKKLHERRANPEQNISSQLPANSNISAQSIIRKPTNYMKYMMFENKQSQLRKEAMANQTTSETSTANKTPAPWGTYFPSATVLAVVRVPTVNPTTTDSASNVSSSCSINKQQSINQPQSESNVADSSVQPLNPPQSTDPITSQSKIESQFFRLCDEVFCEVIMMKIPKLVDDLHLVITHDIMREERLKKVEQLKCPDSKDEERRRTKREFLDMLKVRGQGFVPLFMTIVRRFDKENMETQVIVLYCKIVHQLEQIDPINRTYRFPLRLLIKQMLVKNNIDHEVCNIFCDDITSFTSSFNFVERLLVKYDQFVIKRKETAMQSASSENNESASKQINSQSESCEKSDSAESTCIAGKTAAVIASGSESSNSRQTTGILHESLSKTVISQPPRRPSVNILTSTGNLDQMLLDPNVKKQLTANLEKD